MSDTKSVLILDSDETTRQELRELLEAHGYQVEIAADERAAQELLKTHLFDLVISDLDFCSPDAVQLRSWFKEALPAMRFLLMAPFSHAFQLPQATTLGADFFLNKPFTPTDFLRAVEVALGAVDAIILESGDDYVRVPVSEFATDCLLTDDLYVQISSRNYLQIGRKGSCFSAERAQAYEARGVRWFHLAKEA